MSQFLGLLMSSAGAEPGWFRASALALMLLSAFTGQGVFADETSKSSIAVASGAPGSLSAATNQADPGNSLRIYRPAGGFKTDRGQTRQDGVQVPGDPIGSEPVFFADRVWADPIASASLGPSAFEQVLDGFSARWQRRLGTPAACAMILCQGSCAATDAACEITSSAGCADMPEGASAGCTAAAEGCTESHEGCAAKGHACAEKSEAGAGKDHACAEMGEACTGKADACPPEHGCKH